jgi:hypothetical protein
MTKWKKSAISVIEVGRVMQTWIAYSLVSASKTIDLSYNYRHDIVKEIGDKAMGKAIGVVSRQVL